MPALDEIVNDALELDPSEWPEFLKARCGTHPALLADAESLLTMQRDHPGLLLLPTPVIDAAPKSIGRYRIVREVGRGGMGRVYEAVDPRLGRDVALKLLPGPLAMDPRWRRALHREAQLLGAMNHPNIARVFTVESSDGLHFITMELLQEGTLDDMLASGGLSIDVALTICRKIASALEAMHQKDIVHGDLKPGNVAVSQDGVVKVLDFGLSRYEERAAIPIGEGIHGHGLDSLVPGTPGFLAPELVQGQAPGKPADVWAFGCILYECITGRPAFAAGPLDRNARQSPSWRRIPPETPSEVLALLQACLRRNPVDRPAFRQIRQEVDAVLTRRTMPARAEYDQSACGADRTNLPPLLGRTIGRESEQQSIHRALERTSLVSVTGSGGCGKTRLVLETSRHLLSRFEDGVWFVDLSSITTSSGVEHAVATALGVRETPPQPLGESIRTHLGGKEILIVLDDCEHLLTRVRTFAPKLLDASPDLRLLATSRTPLGIDGEIVIPLPPLRTPDPKQTRAAEVAEVESVALFLDRVRAAKTEFELTEGNASAIAHLCRILDGIPLAIELAASQTGLLSPEEIVLRLGRGRSLPGTTRRTAPGRNVTIRGLIGWSYRYLQPREKLLLRRLSIFPDGWDLTAAESVCAARGVEGWEVAGLHAQLLDRSLIELDLRSRPVTDTVRFRMLSTVREFALSRLRKDGEVAWLARRFVRRMIEFVRELEPYHAGSGSEARLAHLDSEHNNLAGALDLCLRPRGAVTLGFELVVALEKYWMTCGLWGEGRRYTEAFLGRNRQASAARGHALNALGSWCLYTGDLAAARRHYTRALRIGRRVGDPLVIARSVHNLGGVALNEGSLLEAKRLFEEYLSMMEKTNDLASIGRVRSNLAIIAERQGDLRHAAMLYKKALAIFRKLDDRRMLSILLNNLGAIAVQKKDYSDARPELEESLQISREIGDHWSTANTLAHLGLVAQYEGHNETAKSMFQESLSLFQGLGELNGTAKALALLGILSASMAGGKKEIQRGVRLIASSESLLEKIRSPRPPEHRREIEEQIRHCRRALGERDFQEAWAAGRNSELADVIREAGGRSATAADRS